MYSIKPSIGPVPAIVGGIPAHGSGGG